MQQRAAKSTLPIAQGQEEEEEEEEEESSSSSLDGKTRLSQRDGRASSFFGAKLKINSGKGGNMAATLSKHCF